MRLLAARRAAAVAAPLSAARRSPSLLLAPSSSSICVRHGRCIAIAMKPPAFDAASATPQAPSTRRPERDASAGIADARTSARKAARPPRCHLLQRLCVLASAVLLLALSAVTAISALHRVDSPPPVPRQRAPVPGQRRDPERRRALELVGTFVGFSLSRSLPHFRVIYQFRESRVVGKGTRGSGDGGWVRTSSRRERARGAAADTGSVAPGAPMWSLNLVE